MDHRFFSNGTVALGSSLAITRLYPNETFETFTFPIMCEAVDKTNGKDAINTAEKLIDFMEEHFGDCAKEWF